MRKIVFKYLSIYLTIFLLLTQICVQKVSAEHGGSGGTFGEDVFVQYTGYISMEDYSNLPDGMYYFYKYEDGKAWYVSIAQAIPIMLNKSVGIALSEELMASFKTAYTQYVAGLYSNMNNGVMKNGSAIGLAINDIIGCRLVSPQNQSKEVQIPSSEVNNVYNYYNTYITENNLYLPDWINFNTAAISWATSRLNRTESDYLGKKEVFENTDYDLKITRFNAPYTNTYQLQLLSEKYNDLIISSAYSGEWSNYCATLNLTSANNVVQVSDMFTVSSGLSIVCQNNETGASVNAFTGVSNFNPVTYNSGSWQFGSIGSVNNIPVSGNVKSVTVYRNGTITNKVINKIYAPESFYSKRYYDYDVNNDNSITTTNTNIDNSSETNETIYNESAENFTEYYSENNYHIDNSVTIENNTEIINNYYGDSNGGDDNGGGSGSGGDSGGGSGDSPIWDALLAGIVNLLKKIGEIIAAILTGIIEICAKVLEAIASITETFTGVTDFFAAVIGFLPEEIVAIITMGVSLMILITLIHAFFK